MKNLKHRMQNIECRIKNLEKVILSLGIVFGVFIALGQVQASPTENIQPASDIIYNETVRFPSIYVGSQGIGGVTFFNGTIINNTTDVDTGAEIPVTFGDDVRIDGVLVRHPPAKRVA